MFIGRFFISRRMALIIGAALIAVLGGVGFLALNILSGQGVNSADGTPSVPAPTVSEVSPSSAPNASEAPSSSATTTGEATPSGSTAPSESPTPSGSTGSTGSDDTAINPNVPTLKYPVATEFLNEIILPGEDEGTPEQRLISGAATMWTQVLLHAQTNARPNRITETDLIIIGARLKGMTWDSLNQAVTATIDGQEYAVYVCVPDGPQETACTEVIETS